ncbi:transcriptional regulator, TetR family [Solidesulfovibrio fructosivorans JJ]]|uniref:Transcriptional regulator, TetR family n=1 Tax=Solidesulfovibrio fructosivorans JJ] TaxID=596151 RepID=E1JU40_SOLFR|nr:TetR/AcrR family transcriptional regulator [Solidesulfovibrio fructosivorans]EFL51970.1 transcriptional regulator, TetR family [Solidesulfovibrio fructosivorans JJ]]
MVESEESTSVLARILDAAAEEFGRVGFSGAKVDAIARRAGVNKAALYYHVGNKEKLYETVLLQLFAQVAGTLEQAAKAGPDPVAALSALASAMAGLFSRLPVLPRIMTMEMASGARTMPLAALAEFRRIFGATRDILRQGQETGVMRPANPAFVHMALVGTLVVYSLSEPLRRRFADAVQEMDVRLDAPLAEAAAFLGDLIGRGLRPDAAVGETPVNTAGTEGHGDA